MIGEGSKQSFNNTKNKHKKFIVNIAQALALESKKQITHLKVSFMIDDKNIWLLRYEEMYTENFETRNKAIHEWMSVLKKSEKGQSINALTSLKASGFPVKWENFRKMWYCKHSHSRNKTEKKCLLNSRDSYTDLELTGSETLNKQNTRSNKEFIKVVGIREFSHNTKKREIKNVERSNNSTNNTRWLFQRKKRNLKYQAYFFTSVNSLTRRKRKEHSTQHKDYNDIICQGRTITGKPRTVQSTIRRQIPVIQRIKQRSKTADMSREISIKPSPRIFSRPKFDVLVSKRRNNSRYSFYN